MEQLYKTYPHLKEKLEAQLAKIPVERREWFVRNQAAIISKLQQHRHLQSTAAASAAVILPIRLVWITFLPTSLAPEIMQSPPPVFTPNF